MFEHKELDGQRARLLPAPDSVVCGEILEIREGLGKTDPEEASRKQYGIVGENPVERCLPPAAIGDRWPHDATDLPWWEVVNNPPHAGLVAEYTKSGGGVRYRPLQRDNNVVAFTSAGEAVTFKNGIYQVTRGSDGSAFNAGSLMELRKAYAA